MASKIVIDEIVSFFFVFSQIIIEWAVCVLLLLIEWSVLWDT